jgi:hypothetical protein
LQKGRSEISQTCMCGEFRFSGKYRPSG